MADFISTQDLVDAKRDISDLGLSINTDGIITPRYGAAYDSLPKVIREMIEQKNLKLAELQLAIDTAVAAGVGAAGWYSYLVVHDNGETQKQINDYIGATWYPRVGGYGVNDKARLATGELVVSTINGNTNDPDSDMTGWKFDSELIVKTVQEMLSLSAHDGKSVRTLSYHSPANLALAKPYKGGASYIYVSSRSAENDGVSVINGWVLKDVSNVDAYTAGAKGDGVSNDSSAIQNALNVFFKIYIPAGTFLCNIVLTNSFNIQGSGKQSILKPFNISQPVLTNINTNSLSWINDSISDVVLQSSGFTGVGFRYGALPAVDNYFSVGRVTMTNVQFYGFEKGIEKVNGNIGNKYYACDFAYNKYGVYAKGHQLSVPASTNIMHAGCDLYYGCDFTENTVAGVAYYDKTGGSGQWLFDNCLFQFNIGFGCFFDFDIPGGRLFSPIVFANTWFETNGGNTVLIDRVDGTTQSMTSTPRFISGVNDVIYWGCDEFKMRFGIGVADPKRLFHLHDASAPIIQLTNSVTGNSDANRGGLIYQAASDLILENKESGGKVSLNSSGNFVSNHGKVGYGTGAGNSVTQSGNKDSTVTCNKPSGRITTSAQSLAAGASVTFILNNTFISEYDVIAANVRFSPSNSARYYDVKITNISNGSCQVNIQNTSGGALAEAVQINFAIISGSISPT